jgi:hypothetical protein
MPLISASSIVVFPDADALARTGLERIAKAVRFRFGAEMSVHVAVDSEHAGNARALGLQPVEPAAATGLSGVDAWVLALGFLPIFHGEGGFERIALPGNAASRAGKRLYIIEPDGFLHPLQVKPDGSLDAPCTPEFDSHLDRHVFARLGSRNFRGAAYFFPYNGFYVGHPSAFGPIDEFGFRNAHDRALLEKREDDHIVIAVFGGSTVWSPCCLQPETFCSVLEDRLRRALDAEGDARKVSVVNFGVSGHTVLNETMSWLLFCHKLRPEIVIAHDAFNDLANGVQTDPDLLNRNDMTYMVAIEQWGRQLMGASNVPLTQSDDPTAPIRLPNSPQAVVRAYLTRKRQFSDLVEKSGATFVWGTQPAWFGKAASTGEAERFAKIRALSRQLAPMYQALPQLYEMVRRALSQSVIAYPVDVHAAFGNLTDQDSVFVDHAHLNPAGEAIIAGIYAETILDRVLPALQKGKRS